MPKCDGCKEWVDHYFILWLKGTKNKRGRGALKKDPKLVCARCVGKFTAYEIVGEYREG